MERPRLIPKRRCSPRIDPLSGVDSTNEKLKRRWYIRSSPPPSLLISIRLHRGHILIESPCLWLDAIQRRYLAGIGTSRSRRGSRVGAVSDYVCGGRR
ncbi:unnamed protein product [Brassica rapa]|uniref:Uncharacterized protein n=1 Tax=Brassica campestris TaxID=3711 RepID=A0A8D9DHU6_BRACM|nr:unnamed protein product [Brassica rapa]